MKVANNLSKGTTDPSKSCAKDDALIAKMQYSRPFRPQKLAKSRLDEHSAAPLLQTRKHRDLLSW